MLYADRVLFWYLHSLAFFFFSFWFSHLSLLFVSKFAIGNGSVSMRFHRVCDIKNASICNVAMHTEHSLHTVLHGFYYIRFGMANVAVILYHECIFVWFDVIKSNEIAWCSILALLFLSLLSGSFAIVAAAFFIVYSRSNMEERFLLACHTTHIHGNSYELLLNFVCRCCCFSSFYFIFFSRKKQ